MFPREISKKWAERNPRLRYSGCSCNDDGKPQYANPWRRPNQELNPKNDRNANRAHQTKNDGEERKPAYFGLSEEFLWTAKVSRRTMNSAQKFRFEMGCGRTPIVRKLPWPRESQFNQLHQSRNPPRLAKTGKVDPRQCKYVGFRTRTSTTLRDSLYCDDFKTRMRRPTENGGPPENSIKKGMVVVSTEHGLQKNEIISYRYYREIA